MTFPNCNVHIDPMEIIDLLDDGDFRAHGEYTLSPEGTNVINGEWRPAGSDTWQPAELHIGLNDAGEWENIDLFPHAK